MDYRKVVAVASVLAITLSGCCLYMLKDDEAPTINGEVTGADPTFGDILVSFTTEDMLEKGFHYGDYLHIEVESYILRSVLFVENVNCSPYFSFYVADNEGSAGIGLFFGTMVTADMGSKVVITYEGKCDGYQHMAALKTLASDGSGNSDPKDYANYFEITGGDIAPGRIFRTYSMMKDSDVQSRSWYVNKFAEECGIEYMIMLSCTESKLKSVPESFKSTYGQMLIDSGRYSALQMYPADLFDAPEKIRTIFDAITGNDGPYLIFCDFGKDRTGAITILIQGLCGASNDEIRDTYMKSFENLYHVEKGGKTYQTIQESTYNRLIYMLANHDKKDGLHLIDWAHADTSEINVASAAVAFVKETLGLTDEQISLLREKLATPVLTEADTGTNDEITA